MGRTYLFSCSKCNFTARVAGGVDNGRNCFVRTIQCHDCRQLYDVATHVRLSPPLALRNKIGVGPPESRLPRRLPKAELRLLIPEHVAHSTTVVSCCPGVPEGMLVAAMDARWVELAVECPRNARHRFDSWTDPGRCPYCLTYLDKSLWPFLVWE